MKRLYILILICFSSQLFGQNNVGKADDFGRIILTTYIPEQVEGLTPTAQNVLSNKLSQIASLNGLGGSGFEQRFILTANVDVLSKDITPTAPPMQAYTLGVTLYVGDGIDGTLFASESVTLKGVGENETKAYLAALKNLRPDRPEYQKFLDQGKFKIIEYYNSRCDFIIKQAQALESQGSYEEAIYNLMLVPEVCADCYSKCMDLVGVIYQKMIDHECKRLLAQANNAWNSGQDDNAANNAAEFLSQIDPHSACFNDALAISEKIAKRIRELDQREWSFQMKKYQDNVDSRNAIISAARDIGVAFGKNQPRKVVKNIRGWF